MHDRADALTSGSGAPAGRLKTWARKRIERLSGVDKYLSIYDVWRTEIAATHPRKMNELLRLLDVKLDISDAAWPPEVAPGQPLVMLANHPFGLADGISLAAMAEQLERPYKVLINTEFLRIEAFRDHCLPVDFSNSEAALRTNLATRKEALRLLQAGVTLMVFPAGTVATAPRVFGRAQELPWKTFTASLVQKSKASILPVFFEGQNSLLFHAASHINASLRMSLLIAEFRRFPKSCMRIRAGAIAPFETLAANGDRQALTDELFLAVHRMAPWAHGLGDRDILPPERLRKNPYKWDLPLGKG